MFEFIGMVVVAFVVWSLCKATLSGALKGHMLRSVDHAVSLGVPYDFSLNMIQKHSVMKAAVSHISKMYPDFRQKDVYIQYGEAVLMLYQVYLMEKSEGKHDV